ncbi:ATP-binding protein [Rhodoferax sp.]|uniref:ATP-binding protein n=1 Tax=Rhodoferax sp. TaxID=50421 RepID=UPI00374C966C
MLLDLGVLVVNFYTSYQISEDALAINLAGRQRMLSQRTAKALLALATARSQGQPAQPQTQDLAELRGAVQLFDTSLQGFQHGALLPGGNGQTVFLPPATDAAAVSVLQQAQAVWTPYQLLLAPVLAGRASDTELQAAAAYAQSHNLALLEQMNTLTTALEATASQRATRLRRVQTVGILLALLNFGFILFKFLRRLHQADAAMDAATEENREILASVREGLFLITPDFRLGSQISQSAHQLFGRPLLPGEDFIAMLESLVGKPVLQDAKDYVALLFAPHVKEALVQDINPLLDVPVQLQNRLGQSLPHTLAFRFNRVRAGTAVVHLLVTVQDISERTLLAHKLQDERQRSHRELSLLLAACDADPALLRQFVARAEAGLLEINDLLRDSAHGTPALRQALDQAARRIHALKGDAGALGLEMLVQQAHAFESMLLRVYASGGGDPLLALPLPLEDLLAKIGALKRLAGLQRGSLAQAHGEALNAALARLAQDLAESHGKRVSAAVQMGQHGTLGAEAADLVREIATQLTRNAVVHGIETPAARQQAGKAAVGRLELQLGRHEAEWILRIRDDGQGLHPAPIRDKLIDLGWYTALQLESFDDAQIIGHIFKPGFSTADGATEHAGRGVGLDLVQANVQRLGGHLTLASTPGQFTEFLIRFDV